MTNPAIETVLREMKEIDLSKEYYAITLLANESGKLAWAVQSNFFDLVDVDLKRELRVASLVKPENMAKGWKAIGQDYLVVKNKTHLYFYYRLGGNALVEKSIAQESPLLNRMLEPVEVIRSGYTGFKTTRSLPKSALDKAPTPKCRMKVIKRENYKCAICGRSPADYSDIELHVHHIRPFGEGGLTEDCNLITLCHTCHKGLDPHSDFGLYALINDGKLIDVDKNKKKYFEGVKLYREKISPLFNSHSIKDDEIPKNKRKRRGPTKQQ